MVDSLAEEMLGTHIYGKNDHHWHQLCDKSSYQATHVSNQPDYNKQDAEALS